MAKDEDSDDFEDDDEFNIIEQLGDIIAEGKGEYRGVRFDLSHPDISPADWICPIPDSEEGTLSEPDLPLIWYPWFDGTPPNGAADQVKASGNQKPIRRFTKRSTECVVQSGDSIEIERVERKQISDHLEHAHDAEIRNGFLKIVRGDRIYKVTKQPLVFRGLTSILSRQDSLSVFDCINSRICDHFKLKSVRSRKFVGDDGSYAYRALLQARKLDDLLVNAEDMLHGGWYNDGALLGFLWAKAEAEINLKPLAKSAIQREERSKIGGSNSGKARRMKAQTGWQSVAKTMALEIRAEQPYASQDKVAEDIRLDWRSKLAKCPQHPTLKKFVSDLEKVGELPKRVKPDSTGSALVEAQ